MQLSTIIGTVFESSVQYCREFFFVVPLTFVGALNGYVLTKWRFRGANLCFALLLFGCFVPFQVVLMPMARTLGWLGLASWLRQTYY